MAFSPDANLLYAIDYASEVRVFGLVDGASWSEIAVVSQLQTGGVRTGLPAYVMSHA